MARRTAVIVTILLLAMSLTLQARKLTTTQIRENTIRINALEIERIDITDIIGDEPVTVDDDEIVVVADDRSLNFDFDKSVVKPQYFEMLQKFVVFIEHNNYDLVIEGHTDSKGTNAYNMGLGMRRAQSVANKLVEFGLSRDRIIGIESKGEELPIATNDTAEGRAENRRIEFRLVRRGN